MSNFSAQGSITIKRLRNGDTIYLTFELNGKPLYQAVDDQTGAVVPDWTQAANQPIITPRASTTRSNAVNLSLHRWKYNGVDLNFSGAAAGGWTPDTTGKFAINADGALKIIANLASKINIANDTLLYSCVATVAGVEYNLSKSIDIQIQKSGASSYYGFINANTTQLDSSHTSATLESQLWLAASQVQNFYVKWYKAASEWIEKRGQRSITVDRADVDGSLLVTAEFYLNEGDTDYVFRAGVSIIDTLDEIILIPYISSANTEVDTGKPVTVKARIIKAATGTEITPANPVWKFVAMDGTTWTKKKESSTDSIEITTAETDLADGSSHDIEVLVDVSYN